MDNGDTPANPVPGMDMQNVGLTKREQFAAMAMQGLLSNQYLTYDTEHLIRNRLAHQAVLAADALLEELNSSAGESDDG